MDGGWWTMDGDGDGDEMDGKAFGFGGSFASWEMDLSGVEGGISERAFGAGFLYYRRFFKDFLFDTLLPPVWS